MEEIKVYTDGGARGNPGPAGIGAVAYKGDKKLFELSEYIGLATNNIAEYTALKKALKKLVGLNVASSIIVNMDSELIVKQMTGEYKVKNADLKGIYNDIKGLIENLNAVEFKHVRRELNKEADSLVNLALDKEGK